MPGRKVIRGSRGSGSSLSSTLEKSAMGERLRGRRRIGRESESRYEEIEGDRSSKARCHDPKTGLSFVRKVQSSSGSYCLDEAGACKTNSTASLRVDVFEVPYPTRWQEKVSAKWKKNCGTGFLEYVAVQQKRAGIETERCSTLRLLE